MKKGIVVGLMIGLTLVLLVVSGCGGGPIKAKTITSSVSNNTVSISAGEVQNSKNVRFEFRGGDVTANFMAYTVGDEIQVRANVCPPCRSTSFSLDNTKLICDRCSTTFEAKTGKGISGACVNYPKAAVPYDLSGGNIIMKADDLLSAYMNTVKPGLP